MTDGSLRSRTERAMIWPLLLVVTGVFLLASVFSYITISDQRDQHLRQSALLVELLSKHEAAERDQLGSAAPLPKASPQEDLAVSMEYRVWSDMAPVTQSSGMPPLAQIRRAGFHTIEAQGRRWRIFVLHKAGSAMSVELAEPLSLRLTETALVVFSLALPLALLIIAVAIIGRRGIAQALAPLSSLSRMVDTRHSDDLTPVEISGLDHEVKPMGRALNRLFSRLDEALARERAFSDNAAHELRTPLASLRLRSQVIAARLKNDPTLARDSDRFQQAIDRASNVIDRLLCLARLEQQERGNTSFDFSACVEDVIAEIAPSASARLIDLMAELTDDATMSGDEVAVTLAVRNLLENAIKFTPSSGKVGVVLTADEEHLVLRVSDTGPGLPPGTERRVFERFYRGSSAIPGSGLGLALVDAVAHLHSGSVHAVNGVSQGSIFTLTLTRT